MPTLKLSQALRALAAEPYLAGSPGGELAAELELGRRLDPVAGPEEQAVFVLDLQKRDGRLLAERHLGVRVGPGQERLGPGFVGRLEVLIKEQEPFKASPPRTPRSPTSQHRRYATTRGKSWCRSPAPSRRRT